MCRNEKSVFNSRTRFSGERCNEAMKGIVEPGEKLLFYAQVGLVKNFCYLKAD